MGLKPWYEKGCGRHGELPFDRESRHSRFLRQHISSDSLDRGPGRRLIVHFLRVIFIVLVIAHTYKLAAVVAAGQQDDRHAEDVG